MLYDVMACDDVDAMACADVGDMMLSGSGDVVSMMRGIGDDVDDDVDAGDDGVMSCRMRGRLRECGDDGECDRLMCGEEEQDVRERCMSRNSDAPRCGSG